MCSLVRYLDQKTRTESEIVRLARGLGVEVCALRRLLRGQQRPDFEWCCRIAAYFRLDPNEVFFMAGHPEWAAVLRTVSNRSRSNLRLIRLEDEDSDEDAPLAYRLKGACKALGGISRNSMTELVRSGKIVPKRLGGQRLFLRRRLETFLDSLPDEVVPRENSEFNERRLVHVRQENRRQGV